MRLIDHLLEQTPDLSVSLEPAMVFDFSSVDEALGLEPANVDSLPCLVPPFDSCWFETRRNGRSVGYLVEAYQYDTPVSVREAVSGFVPRAVADFDEYALHTPEVVPLWNADTPCTWYVQMQGFDEYDIGADKSELMESYRPCATLCLDACGRYVPRSGLLCGSGVGVLPAHWTGGRSRFSVFDSVLYSLALLHAVNVRPSVVEPSRSIQKKRARHGKRPLVKYSVIDVPRSTPGTAALPSARGTDRLALHMVRGHFKRRKTGVFFWHSYARGSAENGVVLSQYAVRDRGGPANTDNPF